MNQVYLLSKNEIEHIHMVFIAVSNVALVKICLIPKMFSF
jgi:hypothetical protein